MLACDSGVSWSTSILLPLQERVIEYSMDSLSADWVPVYAGGRLNGVAEVGFTCRRKMATAAILQQSSKYQISMPLSYA